MDDLACRADALWRAVVYTAVVQLHLVDNVLMSRPLRPRDVKPAPSGHWGTVPGVAWALTHVALAAETRLTAPRLMPVLGAGHAGIVQLSLAWVMGHLEGLRPKYTADASGLSELARSFPEVDGLGAEVNPMLPAGGFVGGCLGGALAFASGAAIDAPDQIVVPIIGDGECETPTTAASWLPCRDLPGARLLPIIHCNGFRMGSASLLGNMTDDEITAYFAGHGWCAVFFRIQTGDLAEHAAFHNVLTDAAEAVARSERMVIILRCTKGWSGPATLGGPSLLGTANIHKTPLTCPATDPVQRGLLQAWLTSYRPRELFDNDGRPAGRLAQAIAVSQLQVWRIMPVARKRPPRSWTDFKVAGSFTQAVTNILCAHAAQGDFRVFSPDELASNRLGDLVGKRWVLEVLAEEVLFGWLAGWTASGRRGVFISYESFAPLVTASLVAQLKQRRCTASTLPSLNLLLTSYGWHNTYTHGDPSLATTMLGVADPVVRVFTPADPTRLAATLDMALGSNDQVNIVIAGKHSTVNYPGDAIAEELTHGIARWPHLSDEGEPDLTIACAGDIPAAIVSAAVPLIHEKLNCRVRVVNINDLTVLGDPHIWPAGLSDNQLAYYIGEDARLLIVTLGHPAAIWGLLAGRSRRSAKVVGWREPSGPMAQAALAAASGLDVHGLLQMARHLMRPQCEIS
ncbi:MAG: hypothetical protein ACRDPY_16345 [Streptosporangiaceae bacterium]